MHLVRQVLMVVLADRCCGLEDSWGGLPSGAFLSLAAMTAVMEENFGQ